MNDERHKRLNVRKRKQLGMPLGTAANRLRKQIFFRLVCLCEMDICHRCRQKISSSDELSIDHKEPWLDAEDPTGIFFDLNNIAFSHRSCNSLARRTKLRPQSKSGLKGVSLEKRRENGSKPWKAAIGNGVGKTRFIGYFATAEEAARAYDVEAKKTFGQNAVTNGSLGLIKGKIKQGQG